MRLKSDVDEWHVITSGWCILRQSFACSIPGIDEHGIAAVIRERYATVYPEVASGRAVSGAAGDK